LFVSSHFAALRPVFLQFASLERHAFVQLREAIVDADPAIDTNS
jgi:hypothetical protein